MSVFSLNMNLNELYKVNQRGVKSLLLLGDNMDIVNVCGKSHLNRVGQCVNKKINTKGR